MTDLASAVVAALVDHGVDTVFGIPGTHNLPLFAAMDVHGVRVVVPRHEQGAAYAADAYARTCGRPGVVVTTTGPGALNAATGMAQAWSDSSPVLLIAPGMPTTKPSGPTGRLHEMPDQTAAMAACVDRAQVVRSGAAARDAVARFHDAASYGRPRPWYLEVPLDLLGAPAGPDRADEGPGRDEDPGPRHHDTSAAGADAVGAAASILSGARRPVVIAGGGARAAGVPLTLIAERLGAPVVSSVNGRGVVAEDHPLSLGATMHLPATRVVLADADAVLVVGCELAESDTWTDALALTGPVIRLDVDPGMAATNIRDPEVFLQGRADRVLPELLAQLEPEADGERLARVAQAHDAVRADSAASARPWRGLLAGLAESIPPDAVLVADNATVSYRAAQIGLPVRASGRYLFPSGFGTLGWAVPAAVGATVAGTGRPVAAITGDGGLAFSVAELATLGDVGGRVPVVVVDNGGYGEIRDQMRDRGDRPYGVDLANPRWDALASAFGAHHAPIAASTDDPACAEAVAEAVTRAFRRDRPTLVVVREGGA